MVNDRYVVGIGAANIDIMGRSRRGLVPEDSNPGHIKISVGGATHNVCVNAARLSVPIRFMTTTGDDYFGSLIRSDCEKSGLDTTHFIVFSGETSSSYMSIHNQDGEMNIAVSDMRILQKLEITHLEEKKALLTGAAAIVFDTGLPEKVIYYLLENYGHSVPLFVDTVSTTYAEKLVNNMKNIHTIKPNIFEAEILSGHKINSFEDIGKAAAIILSKGVQRVFISLGKNGVFYADSTGQTLHRKQKVLDNIENATGAGDSFLGALLYSYMKGSGIEETLSTSMTAAALTIMNENTINPEMSEALIKKTIPLLQ